MRGLANRHSVVSCMRYSAAIAAARGTAFRRSRTACEDIQTFAPVHPPGANTPTVRHSLPALSYCLRKTYMLL